MTQAGYPVVGDRLYGTGENTDYDLQLQAYNVSFTCPFTGVDNNYKVPPDLLLKTYK